MAEKRALIEDLSASHPVTFVPSMEFAQSEDIVWLALTPIRDDRLPSLPISITMTNKDDCTATLAFLQGDVILWRAKLFREVIIESIRNYSTGDKWIFIAKKNVPGIWTTPFHGYCNESPNNFFPLQPSSKKLVQIVLASSDSLCRCCAELLYGTCTSENAHEKLCNDYALYLETNRAALEQEMGHCDFEAWKKMVANLQQELGSLPITMPDIDGLVEFVTLSSVDELRTFEPNSIFVVLVCHGNEDSLFSKDAHKVETNRVKFDDINIKMLQWVGVQMLLTTACSSGASGGIMSRLASQKRDMRIIAPRRVLLADEPKPLVVFLVRLLLIWRGDPTTLEETAATADPDLNSDNVTAQFWKANPVDPKDSSKYLFVCYNLQGLGNASGDVAGTQQIRNLAKQLGHPVSAIAASAMHAEAEKELEFVSKTPARFLPESIRRRQNAPVNLQLFQDPQHQCKYVPLGSGCTLGVSRKIYRCEECGFETHSYEIPM